MSTTRTISFPDDRVNDETPRANDDHALEWYSNQSRLHQPAPSIPHSELAGKTRSESNMNAEQTLRGGQRIAPFDRFMNVLVESPQCVCWTDILAEIIN